MKIKVTLKLDLNVPDFEYDVVSYVRSHLPSAFGQSLTDNPNPVEIVDIAQRKYKIK